MSSNASVSCPLAALSPALAMTTVCSGRTEARRCGAGPRAPIGQAAWGHAPAVGAFRATPCRKARRFWPARSPLGPRAFVGGWGEWSKAGRPSHALPPGARATPGYACACDEGRILTPAPNRPSKRPFYRHPHHAPPPRGRWPRRDFATAERGSPDLQPLASVSRLVHRPGPFLTAWRVGRCPRPRRSMAQPLRTEVTGTATRIGK